MKARLKLVCVLHLALGVAHNIRLLPSILTRLGLRYNAGLLLVTTQITRL